MTVLGFGLAIVIGLSLGMLGGGGSILTVPVLVYVLGLPMKGAVPLSLIVVGVTSAVGAANHQRHRNIRWDAAVAFAPAAVIGALLGTRIATVVSGRIQLIIFAILMVVAAISMFVGPAAWSTPGTVPTRRSPAVVALLGGCVGLLTGLVGVGGGFMYVPALVLLAGLEMREAVGTSLVLIVVSCLAALLGYLGRIAIDWQTAGFFTALAIVGVMIGSGLAKRVPQAALRRGFAVLLLVMGVLVLIKPR